MGKHSSREQQTDRGHKPKHTDTIRQPNADSDRARKLDALPDKYHEGR